MRWTLQEDTPGETDFCKEGFLVKMRLSTIFAGAALCSTSQALNILLNNDDGFGSANLRETYRLFKEKGHNGNPSNNDPGTNKTNIWPTVWLVAPATKQSGKGGASDFTAEANLTGPSQYDLIPKGAPSVWTLDVQTFTRQD